MGILQSKGIATSYRREDATDIGTKLMSLQELVSEITKPLIQEDVKIPINVGDTVLMGRFKNKKVVVKTIDYNEKGDLLINGRTALKFRLTKKDIDLTIEGDILRVEYKKTTTKDSVVNYIQKNIAKRAFNFGWRISRRFDLTKLDAKLQNGLLHLHAPYADDSKPKAVTIK